MIHFSLLARLITMIVTVPLMLILIKKRKKYLNILFSIALWLYIVQVIGMVFFPIQIDSDIPNFNPNINIIPLSTTIDLFTHTDMHVFIKQILGNILLFIPFGFLIPTLFGSINKEIKIAKFSLIASLFIELGQLALNILFRTNMRSVDIDDIILNVLGAIIGFEIQKILFKLEINKDINIS